MNSSSTSARKPTGSDARRQPRRAVVNAVEVINTMTDRVMGQLGNVSETGMLLLTNTPLIDDALYQVRFNLSGSGRQQGVVEVGVHLLWQDGAGSAGKTWAGFRFINLPEPWRQNLREWLANAH